MYEYSIRCIQTRIEFIVSIKHFTCKEPQAPLSRGRRGEV